MLKIPRILTLLIPMLDNWTLEKKLNNIVDSLDESDNEIAINKFKTEYCVFSDYLFDCSKIDDDLRKLFQLNKNELERKAVLDDKAKTNILGVTISVTLIMGAYEICNNVYEKYSNQVFQIGVFVIFCISALYMLAAGIISFKTLTDRNIVYMPKDDGYTFSNEELVEELNKDIGRNRVLNLIRNNCVYTSYECIRNALVCLFLVMVISIFPVIGNYPDKEKYTQNGSYVYSMEAADVILKNNIAEKVNQEVAGYLVNKGNTLSDDVLGFVVGDNSMFIKISVKDDVVSVLDVEILTPI